MGGSSPNLKTPQTTHMLKNPRETREKRRFTKFGGVPALVIQACPLRAAPEELYDLAYSKKTAHHGLGLFRAGSAVFLQSSFKCRLFIF